MSIIYLVRVRTPDYGNVVMETTESSARTPEDALQAVKEHHGDGWRPFQVIALDTENPQGSYDASDEIADLWWGSLLPDFDPDEDTLPYFLWYVHGDSLVEELREQIEDDPPVYESITGRAML